MDNGLNKRTRVSDFLCMMPAFVFTLSILLVRLHQFSMPLSNIFWSEASDTSTLSELFNYWKCVVILAAGCLAIIVIAFAYFKDQIQFKRGFVYIPVLVYIAFVLVSLAFSDYKYFAVRGMQEHFEGTFVLLAYMIMVLFLRNAVDSDRRLKMVIFCALGAVFLVGLLGVTQANGHDFFATVAGQKLITPNQNLSSGVTSWDMIEILNATGQKMYDFAFTEGEVYQTVYNINYVPLYLSLLIPVGAALFVFFSRRAEKNKLLSATVFLVLYGLFLYNFFAANSASGYFGLTAIVVSSLIVFQKYIKKWIKPIICLLVVLGLVMGLMADRWLPEIKKAFSSFATYVYADNELSTTQYEFENAAGRTRLPVDYIESNDGYLLFGINGDAIKIIRDDTNASYVITDKDDNQLFLRQIEGEDSFEILDTRFHDYVKLSLTRDEANTYIVITMPFHGWTFRYDGNTFLYQNLVGKEVALDKVSHSSLFHDYAAATGRYRIWATTIPMLSKYLLAGAGADCYTFVFPQNDYATLYSVYCVYGTYGLTTVTDKAHNIYMQYWVNTGLISLLAWLTLVGYYLVGAVKQFRKRGFVEFSDFVNGGIFCGIIGFLFVAFFNDGSVNTMPMFYTMLGTGLAINMKDKWVKTEEASGKKEAAMPEV